MEGGVSVMGDCQCSYKGRNQVCSQRLELSISVHPKQISVVSKNDKQKKKKKKEKKGPLLIFIPFPSPF